MNFKYISLLYCLLILIGCVKKKEFLNESDFPHKSQINFHDMGYPDILGITMQLIKIDSLLLINDYHGDSLINVFNIHTGIVERKLISKGNGPEEMISPLDMQLNDDKLSILSRPICVLSHIPLQSIMNGNTEIHKDMQLPPKSDHFVPLANNTVVFSGFWEKRYAIAKIAEGADIKEFGEFPDFWKAEEDIPNMAKAIFHQCGLRKHPNLPLFVSCSSHILEIYKYDMTEKELPQLIFQKQLGKYKYNYQVGDYSLAKSKEGFDPIIVDFACSEKYIYLIAHPTKDRQYCDIFVIDWEGNPIRMLESNKKITCLTVDENEKKGYCVIADPNDTLVSFDIP